MVVSHSKIIGNFTDDASDSVFKGVCLGPTAGASPGATDDCSLAPRRYGKGRSQWKQGIWIEEPG